MLLDRLVGHIMTTYTVREIAERERVSIDTVKRAIKNGHLKGHRVGTRGDWRIEDTDYLSWIQAGRLSQPTKDSSDP